MIKCMQEEQCDGPGDTSKPTVIDQEFRGESAVKVTAAPKARSFTHNKHHDRSIAAFGGGNAIPYQRTY